MKKLLLFCLLLCHFSLQPEKDYEGISSSSSRTEVYHDSHNYSVTYEHENHYDSGSFYSSVTFEHTIIDNHDHVEASNFSMNYIPHEKDHRNAVEIADNHHEIKEDHHQYTYENNNSYNQSDYELSANNGTLDNYFDKMVDGIESRNNGNHSTHQNQCECSKAQKSVFYRWCQEKKESWFGPSEETLRERRELLLQKQAAAELQIKKAADLQRKRDTLKQPINQTELEQAYQQHQNNVANSTNKTFTTTLEKRNLPFDKSLQNQIRATHSFALRPSTIGFLQSHNIDHHSFMELHGLAIQHQLTRELIENLNAFADLATTQRHNQNLMPIIKAGASVSSMAQNYNQSNRLLDAISGTNCSHGFLHYLHGMTLQAFNRCEKMATALAFFNCEITNYTLAAARGVAKGIVSSEIAAMLMSGVGSIASTLAPELTASVYAGASSIIVPIAVVAGSLCALAIIGELGHLGYLYTTDQIDDLQAEYDRITKFAGQFYNFDQAPAAHVENIAMLATTLIWPWQRETIFNSLMGMKNVCCNIYLDADTIMQQQLTVTSKQFNDALEYIKQPELNIFNIEYKEIFNKHIFDFHPQHNPGLVPAGINQLINAEENAAISQLFLKNEFDPTISNLVNAIIAQSGADFLTTDVGRKMLNAATKKYELDRLADISKDYCKLLKHQVPQDIIDTFCRCHELSIVPKNLNLEFEQLHSIFKDKHVGLPELNAKNPYLTMQIRHIFYPSLQPQFDNNYQTIDRFVLNGFHHDEYGFLEKSGLFKFVTKTYGSPGFGSQECFIATTNWGNGIICKEDKTFFPSSWSKEKTAQVISEAAQHRIKELEKPKKSQLKFLCQGPNNMLIDIVINQENVIVSAYPSEDNFLGTK